MVFRESEDNSYNCRLFARLQIICAIADYLRDCRFLDLVLFLRRNLQDFWRIGGFLEDSWIMCTIADNLYIADYSRDCGLFARLCIIRTISQITCGIEDTCANTYTCQLSRKIKDFLSLHYDIPIIVQFRTPLRTPSTQP